MTEITFKKKIKQEALFSPRLGHVQPPWKADQETPLCIWMWRKYWYEMSWDGLEVQQTHIQIRWKEEETN